MPWKFRPRSSVTWPYANACSTLPAQSAKAALWLELERSGDIPPMMLHLIASGERAGELDSMLARAAEQQEKNLAARIALVVSLFEPIMLVLMGGVWCC